MIKKINITAPSNNFLALKINEIINYLNIKDNISLLLTEEEYNHLLKALDFYTSSLYSDKKEAIAKKLDKLKIT